MSVGAHRWHRSGQVAAILVALVVTGTMFVLAVQSLVPANLQARPDPTVIELVFDNRGVVLAARLLLVLAAVVLIVGAVFIVGSMVVRMRNGDWLKRIGPFEVSETAAAELADQLAYWRATALDRQRRFDEATEAVELAE